MTERAVIERILVHLAHRAGVGPPTATLPPRPASAVPVNRPARRRD